MIAQPIRRADNTTIGWVRGDLLYKMIRESVHLLRKPPAIAWDVEALIKAQNMGARNLEVRGLETNQIWSTDMETLWYLGYAIDRGHGEQQILELGHWQVRPWGGQAQT